MISDGAPTLQAFDRHGLVAREDFAIVTVRPYPPEATPIEDCKRRSQSPNSSDFFDSFTESTTAVGNTLARVLFQRQAIVSNSYSRYTTGRSSLRTGNNRDHHQCNILAHRAAFMVVRRFDTVRVCCQPRHLRRTLLVSVVVGTWLTLFNQGGAILEPADHSDRLVVVLLNYITPFLVANAGLVSRADSSD